MITRRRPLSLVLLLSMLFIVDDITTTTNALSPSSLFKKNKKNKRARPLSLSTSDFCKDVMTNVEYVTCGANNKQQQQQQQQAVAKFHTQFINQHNVNPKCAKAFKRMVCHMIFPYCRQGELLPPCASLKPSSSCSATDQYLDGVRTHLPTPSAAAAAWPTAKCSGGTKYAIIIAGHPDAFIQRDASSFYNMLSGKLDRSIFDTKSTSPPPPSSSPYPPSNIFTMMPGEKFALKTKQVKQFLPDNGGSMWQVSMYPPHIQYEGRHNVNPRKLRRLLFHDVPSTCDDDIVFYITTHGSAGTTLIFDASSTISLTPEVAKNHILDYVRQRLTGGELTQPQFRDMIRRMKFRRMLLFLDFCFSRNFVVPDDSRNIIGDSIQRKQSKMERLFRKKHVLAITASWNTEEALNNNFNDAILATMHTQRANLESLSLKEFVNRARIHAREHDQSEQNTLVRAVESWREVKKTVADANELVKKVSSKPDVDEASKQELRLFCSQPFESKAKWLKCVRDGIAKFKQQYDHGNPVERVDSKKIGQIIENGKRVGMSTVGSKEMLDNTRIIDFLRF